MLNHLLSFHSGDFSIDIQPERDCSIACIRRVWTRRKKYLADNCIFLVVADPVVEVVWVKMSISIYFHLAISKSGLLFHSSCWCEFAQMSLGGDKKNELPQIPTRPSRENTGEREREREGVEAERSKRNGYAARIRLPASKSILPENALPALHKPRHYNGMIAF